MASAQDFVDYVCDQVALLDKLTYKKMFGEYALYLEGKVVALICNNEVFVKPTAEGERLLGSTHLASPYPGAKLYFQVCEHLEDRELIRRLFLATAAALPVPKPKSKAPARSGDRPAAKQSRRGKA